MLWSQHQKGLMVWVLLFFVPSWASSHAVASSEAISHSPTFNDSSPGTKCWMNGQNVTFTMVFFSCLASIPCLMQAMKHAHLTGHSMSLETNGRQSAGKRSGALNIRCFFITDQAEQGNAAVEHCDADDMVGDFHDKPVQGHKCEKFGDAIMGVNVFHIWNVVGKKGIVRHRCFECFEFLRVQFPTCSTQEFKSGPKHLQQMHSGRSVLAGKWRFVKSESENSCFEIEAPGQRREENNPGEVKSEILHFSITRHIGYAQKSNTKKNTWPCTGTVRTLRNA